MTSIDFFTKETETSSFILDVLSSVNYNVDVFDHIEEVGKSTSPIVIWDLDSFEKENSTALEKLKVANPDSLILAYSYNSDVFQKISNKLIDMCLDTVAVQVQLISKLTKLKEIHRARLTFRERMSHLVGKSEAMQNLRKTVERAILHSGSVLITGETGVGKELIARAVACMYDKFVTVNCSAIPDTLFESELFGHTRGAFTGAQSDRMGLFEAADGGAIFLDEIGDMPLHAQVKLLRVIQNHEIRPLGANKSKHIEVRIIAATNRDLKEAVRQKKFREDLYYRLNVIPLQISPLRNRREDIEDLVNYFIKLYAPAGEPYTISSEALKKLESYSWPGNIRELENVVERAICFTNPGMLQPENLNIDENINFAENRSTNISSYDEFREMQLEDERNFLLKKIKENQGSISDTAEKLGMLRTALYNRLARLGVSIKKGLQ
ncbi:MAG: sigma-54-dependent Fis family transcriptional regulator [Fibrobacteraceae bacterium]|nr:sigma-54-dependent Fis family transcriptional regulator [Fibrobacteraceae bacterium]